MSDYDPLLDDRFISETALTAGGGLYALIYGTPDFGLDFDAQDLTPLINILEFASEATPLSDDFDFEDEHVRGPYDINQLNMFYKDSGLKDVVSCYIDEDEYQYYVYINTD